MIVDDEHWLAVADLFAAAALGGSWPAALNALADACGATNGELIGVGADTVVPFNWITRFDPAGLEEFIRVDGGNPAVNPRVKIGIEAPILQAAHHLDCASEEELRRTFAYADLCRRLDIPHGSQATLLREGGMLIGLAVLRTRRQGRPEAEDRRAFESLSSHVRAAVRTQVALEGQGAALMVGALETLRAAAFVCDATGRVQALTPAAETAARGGPLSLRGGRLAAARQADNRALEAAIAEAAGGMLRPGLPGGRTLVIRAADATGAFQVLDVITLPRRPYALGFEPRALVVVRGVIRDDAELSGLLQAAFGLTPTEAEVALRLGQGEARESIAQGRRTSVETVRSHVKNIFGKLGVSREAELAARLGQLR